MFDYNGDLGTCKVPFQVGQVFQVGKYLQTLFPGQRGVSPNM